MPTIVSHFDLGEEETMMIEEETRLFPAWDSIVDRPGFGGLRSNQPFPIRYTESQASFSSDALESPLPSSHMDYHQLPPLDASFGSSFYGYALPTQMPDLYRDRENEQGRAHGGVAQFQGALNAGSDQLWAFEQIS
ncbi:hypothetical protein CDD82_4766 [Ophiocordyceps australis]|uniref:Uncharacterized protein n=1 Tax=Ophiocordyceps australis TaxID=1399860 RepID=A0A2C5XJM3_9HYPO|nr:hypothetical protein CDD82_4766 [Ophiocordyceps australis]